MNVPSGPGTPKRSPRPEAEASGKYWPAEGKSVPWQEDIVRLATFDDYEED
jgi:hypothetical protein